MQASLSFRESDRCPQFSLALIRQTKLADNADDREVFAAEFDRSANHTRIGAETSSPETGTDDNNFFSPGSIFLREKIASENRLHAKQLEQSGGHSTGEQAFRLTITREVVRDVAIRGEIGNAAAPPPDERAIWI